ncbi:hypothetical protein BT67DRAFT_395381, partial [Trichocladium antarcticum]
MADTRGKGHGVAGGWTASHGAQQVREIKPRAGRRPSTPPPSHAARMSTLNIVSPKPRKVAQTPRLEPPTPPVRTSAIRMTEPTVEATPVQPETQADTAYLAAEHLRRVSQSSASSDDTFVSASSVQSPQATSPVRELDISPYEAAGRKRSPSLGTLSAPDLPRTSTSPNITLESLTNAIVAGNLASARSTAAASQPPPVPAPRRHFLSHHHHHSPLQANLTPSSPLQLQPQRTADSLRSQLTGGSRGSKSPSRNPQQQQQQQQRTALRRTLRGPPAAHSDADSDSDRRLNHHRRRNKVFLGGNRKHAHHEGSRRRWRDTLAPRERRRYEAVWASNRGLFLGPGWGVGQQEGGEDGGRGREAEGQGERAREGPEADMVVDVVVRDIWSRSRLPRDELAEVWALVDRRGERRLRRDEFVVGMWLIDQRLKGRKIPARVSQSVWDSAGVAGSGEPVVVPLPKGGK